MHRVGHRAVFEGIGKAALRRVDVESPKPGEVLMENQYTARQAPDPSQKYPYYPGYCGIGRVVAVGNGVDGAKLGTRVLACRSGRRSHAIQPAATLTPVEDGTIDSLEAAFTVIAAMGLQGVRKLRLETGLLDGAGRLPYAARAACEEEVAGSSDHLGDRLAGKGG